MANASISRAKRGGKARGRAVFVRASALDETLEPAEHFVPLRGDEIERAARVLEAIGLELPVYGP